MVQILALLFDNFKKLFKKDINQAEICELGNAYGICQVPLLDELLNSTIDEPLYWDPVVIFRNIPTQIDTSYEEQLSAITGCVESINSYLFIINTGFLKNIIIEIFPGGGKKLSWYTL